MRNKKKGFTLIELLVVIAMLAVILLIAVPIIADNISKSKDKSYDNQVALFIESSKRLALEYNKDLTWEDTEVEGVKKTTVTLRELAEKDYVDLPVINPKTSLEFDPDNTKVIIMKNKDGSYDFLYEDGTNTGFKLIVGTKSQDITRSTVYNANMILSDVYGSDENGNNITDKITYTCKYNQENIDCNELSSKEKEIGTYYITYRLESNNKTKTDSRTVRVLDVSRPIIEIRPEDNGTKVDKVRVTIIYPEGSKTRVYKTKYETNKTYTVGFEVDENQRIEATCIDKNGLKCETAIKDIRHIRITPPVITLKYTPTTAQNGYYKEIEANIKYREKTRIGDKYYIKTSKRGTSSVGVNKTCGTGNLPNTCSNITPTTTLVENTWYEVEEKNIKVTYNTTVENIGKIYALTYEATTYSDIVEKNIEKVDRTGPTVDIGGNTDSFETSKTIVITASDNNSGLDNEAYSFDNGGHWQTENRKTYTTNGTLNIKVKDKLGNITTKQVTISKIDTTTPTVIVAVKKQASKTQVASNTWSNEKLTVTLTKGTTGSSGGTIYYCVDTANTCNPTTEVTSGREININNTGVFYVRYKITSGAGISSTISSYIGKVDNEAPIITNSIAKEEINKGTTYNRYLTGIQVTDNRDSNISATYTCKNGILQKVECNTIGSRAGVYYIIYDASDSLNNKYSESGRAEVRREIVVKDVSAPVITLKGDNSIRIEVGSTFTEPGYTAVDDEDGDVTSKVETSSSLNTKVVGRYTVTYMVTDTSGNKGIQTRTIEVVDTTKPTITSVGGNPSNWTTSATLTVTASDNYGLHTSAYSFDNGSTWQAGNSKTFTSNGTVNIKVRDASGNISNVYQVNITKIDTTTPTVTIAGKKQTSQTAVASNIWSNEKLTVTLTKGTTGSSGATIYYCVDTANTCNPTLKATSGSGINLNNTGVFYVRYKITSGTGTSSTISSYIGKVDMTTPQVSLSGIQTPITQGDSHSLPTSCTVNGPSGGSCVCKVGSTTVTNTSSLGVGTHTINCTATTGAGKTNSANKIVTVNRAPYICSNNSSSCNYCQSMSCSNASCAASKTNYCNICNAECTNQCLESNSNGSNYNCEINIGKKLFFDPEKGELCNDYDSSKSLSGVNTGCMMWYVIGTNTSTGSINMILDHNVIDKPTYSSSTSWYNAQTYMLNNSTQKWQTNLNKRLISISDINNVTGLNITESNCSTYSITDTNLKSLLCSGEPYMTQSSCGNSSNGYYGISNLNGNCNVSLSNGTYITSGSYQYGGIRPVITISGYKL